MKGGQHPLRLTQRAEVALGVLALVLWSSSLYVLAIVAGCCAC